MKVSMFGYIEISMESGSESATFPHLRKILHRTIVEKIKRRFIFLLSKMLFSRSILDNNHSEFTKNFTLTYCK